MRQVNNIDELVAFIESRIASAKTEKAKQAQRLLWYTVLFGVRAISAARMNYKPIYPGHLYEIFLEVMGQLGNNMLGKEDMFVMINMYDCIRASFGLKVVLSNELPPKILSALQKTAREIYALCVKD